MEKLTDYISKKVVSLEEGECVGFILNVCFDEEKFKLNGFIVCDEESESLNFLSSNNIIAVSEYILIKTKYMLEFGEMVEANNPVGKLVLTENAQSLGVVNNAILINKKIQKLITNKCEINIKNILGFGKNILFFSLRKKLNKKNIFSPKFMTNSQNKIEIQGEKKIEVKNENNNDINLTNSYQIPFKSTISFHDLIGKIAMIDVFGLNNELIIRKNEVITEKTIKSAKKHNKANFLMFNCK